jgi:Family of unknown function (DUF6781)
MNQRTTSGAASAATAEDKEIRERVKDLTTQVLQRGRVDPDAVREIVRAVIGATPGTTAASGADAREKFADAVRELDRALMKSASETHSALEQLASRGKDFTDNDLKEALVSLRRLEQDYAAVANRIGEAMTSNLRREMMELAVSAQNVGVEASARLAGMLSQFAGGISAAPGMATIRDASTRTALVFSGLLAGVADALRDQSEVKSGT